MLDRVDLEWLRDAGSDLVEHPALVRIRGAFRGGELPFPDLCPTCPVLGDGVAPVGRPTRLDKLLIEPSYLCQLDCPACFSALKRRRRGRAPYLLEPELLEAFLDRLRDDGIESVRFVHFEGRGDPLLGGRAWELIRRVRRAFPEAEIQMTSHGVYPFDPELFACGLDVLRLSIDGATPESYERYRRGGRLEQVLDHLRAIRDHRRRYGSRLKVIWKYLVFEWNDAREELALAASLADELEAELLFVLAEEGTGRSRRLPDLESLSAELSVVAPRATAYECRDQLGSAAAHRGGHDAARAAALALQEAVDACRAGANAETLSHLRRALSFDPGEVAKPLEVVVTAEDPLPAGVLREVVPLTRHPSTLAGLANLALALGRWPAAQTLFRRYLQTGPEAPDRRPVEECLIRLALLVNLGSEDLAALAGQSAAALRAAEDSILAVDPGHRPGGGAPSVRQPVADWAADVLLAVSLRTLACLRAARGDLRGAESLFEKLHERHGEDPELEACRRVLASHTATLSPKRRVRAPLARRVQRALFRSR